MSDTLHSPPAQARAKTHFEELRDAMTIEDKSAAFAGLTKAQRVLRVADGTGEEFVKLSVTTERAADSIVHKIQPYIVDANGAYVDIDGEPVMMMHGQHTVMLGQAYDSPKKLLDYNLRDEAARAFLHCKILREAAAAEAEG